MSNSFKSLAIIAGLTVFMFLPVEINAGGQSIGRGGERGSFYTNWDGIWETTFGQMNLAQDGNRVVGTYGTLGGWIEGEISGRVLSFRWSEPPMRSNPYYNGHGEFTLIAGHTNFNGWYKISGGSEEYKWNGTRLRDREITGIKANLDYTLWQGAWETPDGAVVFKQDLKSQNVAGEFIGRDGYGTIEGVSDGWSLDFNTSGNSSIYTGWIEMTGDLSGFSGRIKNVESGEDIQWSGRFLGSALYGNFAGNWNTPMGVVSIMVEHSTGALLGRIENFNLDGIDGKCEITGRIVANSCAFSWRIDGSEPVQTGSGIIKLDETGDSFRGSWRFDEQLRDDRPVSYTHLTLPTKRIV